MQTDVVIAVRPNKTILRRGDTVIKAFNEEFSKADILNEALNQARVEETALNVPKVLEVMKTEGKWAIVSEYIAGKTLQQMMDEEPERQTEYLERFIRLQMEIHAQNCPMLNRLADKMHRKISASGFDATTRYELHTRLDSMKKRSCVCHGDFNPSNVIITEDDRAYILDWAHVTQGDEAEDAARTYLVFSLEGKQAQAEEYLEMYCRITDTAKQYVQRWIPIVAASQSVKGKPEEQALLKHWVNVVEYE